MINHKRYACIACDHSWEKHQLERCAKCGGSFRELSSDEPDTFAIQWQMLKFKLSSLFVTPEGQMRTTPLNEQEVAEYHAGRREAATLLKKLLVSSLEKELENLKATELSDEEGWRAFVATATVNPNAFTEVPEYTISTNY